MGERKITTEEGVDLTMTVRSELAKASGSLYTKSGWTMEEFALAARFVRYVEDANIGATYSPVRADDAIARLRSEGVPSKKLEAIGEGYQRFAADRTLRAAGIR